MTSSRPTVVVLHAHPDDESIFTGIAIRRLADAGARVVLVTATDGDLGESFVPLRREEAVATRRRAEVDAAASVLGVARTVFLGHRDSGLPGSPDNAHPDALATARIDPLAATVAELAADEGASAIIHYDTDGIYRHPDHVAVHRIGSRVAAILGVTSYEATVDRGHLGEASGRTHLIHAAARAAGSPFGLGAEAIDLGLIASDAELEAKRAAITAHASQIRPGFAGDGFAEGYAREWFVRRGPAAILDDIAAAGLVSV
jgi:LmbE family N-acetylglucosaminyl deacetylase